ncbi:MAG: ABC transporter permease subunit [Thermoguttaceae bacterium]|nr:ABC transporter permease subunit [Thermoguttaceae bacterium]
MREVSRRRYGWIRFWDRAARWIITAGGLLVIGTVIGMLVLLVSVVVPLFRPAHAQLRAVCRIPIVSASQWVSAGSGVSVKSLSLSASDARHLDVLPSGSAKPFDAQPSSCAPAAQSGKEFGVQAEHGRPIQAEHDRPIGVGVELIEIGHSGQEDILVGYLISRSGWVIGFELVGLPSVDRPKPEDLQARIIFQQRVQPGQSGSSPEGSGLWKAGSSSGSVQEARIVFGQRMQADQWTLLWSDGSLSLLKIEPVVRFARLGRRWVEFHLKQLAWLPPVSASCQPVQAQMQAEENGGCLAVVLMADNRILVRRQTVQTDLFGESGEKQLSEFWIDSGLPGQVTALALSLDGDRLFVGTHNGYLIRFAIQDSGQAQRLDATWTPDRAPVTALGLLLGQNSLVVGTAYGNLSLWFPVRKQGPIVPGECPDRLTPIRAFRAQQGAVRQIISSQRNKAFVSLGGKGLVHLDYGTTGRHLLQLRASAALVQAAYSSRGNAVLGLGEDGYLYVWQIAAPHAEVSWGALFGRLWYEGHEQTKFLWQSSGTDEPKMSIVPLVFGTLKASFYAMLFALPLGVGSAIYVSHFTKPGIRRAIKPAVEVMAAIPTVVIGFLILLWAAPWVARWLMAVLLSLVALPITFMVWMVVWQLLRRWRALRRLEDGYEFLAILPPLILGVVIVGSFSGAIEQQWFGGNFRQWLYEHTRLQYDQLNALVVALGLGFAIIPIIFSISEDALSSVPHSLTAASLAMGASRWQTLWRVVLPSASPGIFAAVMIGLGRAVGETMIVFMAAGNTPILDPSPFNGFRTLSANIAVEITEHPRDGTLYRVLFLCAVILFLMTFVLNTAAELVRIRLRKRYGQY